LIECLTVKNFQSHKSTHLEFDPGLNVIVGPSDQGKSALVRAWRWLVFNKPFSTSFIRHSAKSCSVAVRTSEADVIRRVRGQENTYHLNDAAFKSFKQGVPEEITAALRLGDINFHHQLDSHFVVTDSGGEVSKFLNRLTNLEIMDEAVALANTKAKASREKAERTKGAIEVIQRAIADSKDIDRIEKKMEETVRMKKEFGQLCFFIRVLKAAVEDLFKIESEAPARIPRKARLKLKKVEEQAERLLNGRGGVAGLQKALTQMEALKQRLQADTRVHEALSEQLSQDFPKVCPLCGETH